MLRIHANPASDTGGEHRGGEIYGEPGGWQVTKRFRTDFKQKITKRAKAQIATEKPWFPSLAREGVRSCLL
jgi:hypothetical protein